MSADSGTPPSTLRPRFERITVASHTKNTTATWIIVVAAILLIGPLTWALTIVMDVLYAVGIGAIVFIAVIVIAFIFVKGRYDEKTG